MSFMSAVAEWLGFDTRSDTGPLPGVLPPPRTAMTSEGALALSAVYRSVQILGVAASQLSLDVWRDSEPVIPKPALARMPNPNEPLSYFLEETVTSLATAGNAYWKVTRNQRSEVTGLAVLNPWECFPSEDGLTLSWAGREKPLARAEFQHLKLMRLPGRLYGLGPIQSARAELEGVRDLTGYSSQWFSSGAQPNGILKTDQVLSPEQADGYKSRWQARQAHEVAVLGQGLDYSPILISPKDALFVEVQGFSVQTIARLFGIPAHLLLASIEGSSMTYTNLAQADLSFVRWTLAAYTREIEEALTFLSPGIQTYRFNLDGILRSDTTTRYQAHSVGLAAGFLTVAEVREMEGLPITSTPKELSP